jgi:hypothetical protein
MAPKKLWRPLKVWVPSEWATMHEAWSRIFASLSNNMPLTRLDLKADFLAGRLVGAARVVNKKEGTEQCIVFEREFWKPVEFPYAWNVTGYDEHYREGEEWHFFVRRRKLDKRYPAATNATPSEARARRTTNRASRKRTKQPTPTPTTIEPLAENKPRRQGRQGSRAHRAIRAAVAKAFPDGHEDVGITDIIAEASPKLPKGVKVKHRSSWGRALGRKKS